MVLGALACALVAASPGPAAGNRNVLSYGDSLSVGTDLFLGRYLHGWNVRSAASISRHADDVPGALSAPSARSLPRVIVVSAGTNDDPGRVSGFARIVRETLAIAGPSRCVVWSTIVRPPYQGVSYGGYNRALRRSPPAAATSACSTGPRWPGRTRPGSARDGVHPTASGYRARAAAIARLVRGCGA